ncbi:PAS/PAC sensor-containing diguanylate cyclase [Ectopseudomonas mendocina]|uniref:PAS/PAC sensor-containing diguanylate cyclase n=1 Tax=Ectopseudomonas mendocina TaxID=300 RepID=A0A379IXI3_ECTME|nr:sensor domain-containing diguanylate cyclase [Pseudomonas mendocina]SUD40846.1 PAS/PAC sensor-containing diguanylate cyclase [Pseudomonas mendocina]
MQSLCSVTAPGSANDERLDGLVRLLGRHFGAVAVLISGGTGSRHIWASHELSDVQLTKIDEACATTLAWPLPTYEGETLGTLYLLCEQPRELDAEAHEALQDFANLAHDLLAREADDARQRHEIAALQGSERRMALAIAGSGTGIWDRNVVTGEIHYSSSWKALLGYAEHEIGNRIEESYTRVHPADLDYVRATIQAHLDQRTAAYEVEHRLRCRDGQYKWVCSRGKVVERDIHGKPLRMIGTTTDITAMRRLSEQVQQAAALMTDLTNEIPGMVFQFRRRADGELAFTHVSAGAQAICGLSAAHLMQDAQALAAIVHPDDRMAFIDSFELSAEELTPWHLAFRVQVPGREIAWCQGEARPRREEDGSVIWHGFMTDVTERKQIEAELQAFATTDFLTQLANRRHFMHRLEAELARLQRNPEQSAAILMFDLDYFKAINDRWGHNVGDQALRHFAAILSSQLRRTDTAGRLGGEEFAVVLSEASLDKAMHFATRIQNELAGTPIQHAGEQIYLAVSVGISSLNAGDASVEAALSRSDIALYCAKRGGRNRIEQH